VELEGNTLQVVHALQKDDKNWCCYGQLLGDVRIILNSLQQNGCVTLEGK
jgi:hypothetical protein